MRWWEESTGFHLLTAICSPKASFLPSDKLQQERPFWKLVHHGPPSGLKGLFPARSERWQVCCLVLGSLSVSSCIETAMPSQFGGLLEQSLEGNAEPTLWELPGIDALQRVLTHKCGQCSLEAVVSTLGLRVANQYCFDTFQTAFSAGSHKKTCLHSYGGLKSDRWNSHFLNFTVLLLGVSPTTT